VDSNISKEVADLGAVIDALSGYQVGYIGHSMGGAVGVLRASQDARIRFLVSLAGMVHTKAFAQREFGTVKPDAGCMWDEPECPLSSAYMNDLTQIDTVVARAAQIKVPWLLVHGTEDDVVPVQDSRDIFARANEPKQLIEIPGSSHVFSGDYTPIMIGHVTSWFQARLK
jgi:pimeloyl-ACP methyl ester carboxylesterase